MAAHVGQGWAAPLVTWCCSPHTCPGLWQGLGPCPVPTPALPLQFPSMKKTLEFKAHDGEIEDIALGPDNKVGVKWLPSSLALQESGL